MLRYDIDKLILMNRDPTMDEPLRKLRADAEELENTEQSMRDSYSLSKRCINRHASRIMWLREHNRKLVGFIRFLCSLRNVPDQFEKEMDAAKSIGLFDDIPMDYEYFEEDPSAVTTQG